MAPKRSSSHATDDLSFFRNQPPAIAKKLCSVMKLVKYSAGTRLVRDSPDEWFYIVVAGSAAVRYDSAHKSSHLETESAHYREGHCFGQFSIQYQNLQHNPSKQKQHVKELLSPTSQRVKDVRNDKLRKIRKVTKKIIHAGRFIRTIKNSQRQRVEKVRESLSKQTFIADFRNDAIVAQVSKSEYASIFSHVGPVLVEEKNALCEIMQKPTKTRSKDDVRKLATNFCTFQFFFGVKRSQILAVCRKIKLIIAKQGDIVVSNNQQPEGVLLVMSGKVDVYLKSIQEDDDKKEEEEGGECSGPASESDDEERKKIKRKKGSEKGRYGSLMCSCVAGMTLYAGPDTLPPTHSAQFSLLRRADDVKVKKVRRMSVGDQRRQSVEDQSMVGQGYLTTDSKEICVVHNDAVILHIDNNGLHELTELEYFIFLCFFFRVFLLFFVFSLPANVTNVSIYLDSSLPSLFFLQWNGSMEWLIGEVQYLQRTMMKVEAVVIAGTGRTLLKP